MAGLVKPEPESLSRYFKWMEAVEFTLKQDGLCNSRNLQSNGFQGVCLKNGSSQGRNLAVTGVCVPDSLGRDWLICARFSEHR